MTEMRRIILVMLAVVIPVCSVVAKEARPMADDPVIEARMMALASNMRCLVCQNQTLADSHSDFAADLRKEMREMMKQGKSDQEIVDFMVARFGDFILFNPPMKSTTIMLWFGPFILLVFGAGILFVTLQRRRRRITELQLSDADLARAERLLSGQEGEERQT
jgi:cytochrome c-type biogenesis protein CcmH